MSTSVNFMRHKAFFLLIFLAFAGSGAVVGLKIQLESDKGHAVESSVRSMRVRIEEFDTAGKIQSSQEATLWIEATSGDSRAEVRGESGELRLIEVRRGSTFERLKLVDGPQVYSSSTALPSSPRVWQGYVDQVFGPADRLAQGAASKTRSERVAGRAATVITGKVDDDGVSLTVEEIVDEASGLTLERRWLRTDPDGHETLAFGVQYTYLFDAQVVRSPDVFVLTPPPDALQYYDAELGLSDLRDHADFRVFGLPNADGIRLVGVSETRSSGPGLRSQHLVNLLYTAPSGTSFTITNQSASDLAGVPRCETPKSVAPGSQGDVVADGNVSCALGSFIETSLGRGVLRSGAPSFQIQLGSTVVFVHASTASEALEIAESLTSLN